MKTTQEEYERINGLVQQAIAGDNQSVLELLKLYEVLIIGIAKRYCLQQYCWKDWVCELKSQFFILLKEYNPDFKRIGYKSDRKVYFSKYISDKLNWYAYYRIVQQARIDGKQATVEDSDEEKAGLHVHCVPDDWSTVLKFVETNFSKAENAIFCLHYCNGYTQAEVGEKVGKSQPTVSRTLDKIEARLTQEFSEGK